MKESIFFDVEYMLQASHGWWTGVGFRNETVLSRLWRKCPEPSVNCLIVQIGVDPITPANRQIVRSLRLLKGK